MIILGIIPARWASTRFPGKPLALIAGKPLVQHVWERSSQARRLHRLIVATDDKRIARVVRGFGGDVVLTDSNHPSGTDRLAEVARKITHADAFINIQGDEPLIDPQLIDQVAKTLASAHPPDMVTAASVLTSDPTQPNIVKVVLQANGNALYFSRSAIPFPRDDTASAPYYRHIGIYGYQRKFLLQFVRWPQGILEKTEQLEQLRALENGGVIRVLLTDHDALGVDAPDDIALVEKRLAESTLSLREEFMGETHAQQI